jgi:hypothetical protein
VEIHIRIRSIDLLGPGYEPMTIRFPPFLPKYFTVREKKGSNFRSCVVNKRMEVPCSLFVVRNSDSSRS